MSDPTLWPATQQAAAIRDGHLGSEELLDLVLFAAAVIAAPVSRDPAPVGGRLQLELHRTVAMQGAMDAVRWLQAQLPRIAFSKPVEAAIRSTKELRYAPA